MTTTSGQPPESERASDPSAPGPAETVAPLAEGATAGPSPDAPSVESSPNAPNAPNVPNAPDAPIAPNVEPSPDAPREAKPAVETRLVSALLRLAMIGASIGLAIWWILDEQRVLHVVSNQTTADERKLALKLMLSGAGVLTIVPLVYLVVHRFWKKSWEPAIEWTSFVSKLCAPLLVTFFLPFLLDWKVFQGHDLLLAVAATCFGLGLERTLRTTFAAFHASRAGDLPKRLIARFPRAAQRIPFWTVVALAAAFAIYFGYYTVLQHRRIGTRAWDMAIFDNMMWNLIRGHWFKASPDLGPTGSHIQYHATFLAYLFAPFYAIYQKPETLLVLQSVLCGFAALPIYLIARLRLESALGAVCIAIAYLMYGPLHSPIFYDFHFFTTAPFWVSWVIYFFETNRRGWLLASWLAAILLREEVSAGLSMAALAYLMSGRRPRWALIGGLLSAAYFLGMKFFIMPLHRTAGPDLQTFVWMFVGLLPPGETSYGGVLQTVVTNPLFTLSSLLTFDKLTYFLKLFGPALLLPFRNRWTWFLFLPGMLFTMLSTGYKPLIEPYFQYTSNFNQYVFFAAAAAIGALGTRPDGRACKAAAIGALLVTSLVFSYHTGAVIQRNTFRAGFGQVSFSWSKADAKRLSQLRDLIEMIPPDASVAATEMEAPHVSQREDCYTIRFFTYDADYLLVSLDEVSWGTSRTNMQAAIATGKYGFVTSRGRFGLWSRKAKHTKDAEGLKLLGM